ncbi:SusC/RagA family TonB-linked outer membrane protein [Botryobacter ruber]|uniref:SusC/RagA family TonB-linked outer membrane protein n=1 Tax=Botryobacter ruber TaxID=2171629 RepID=UPI0013E39A16|nr:TonB-dependent receptor [Botryobacter ruber]
MKAPLHKKLPLLRKKNAKWFFLIPVLFSVEGAVHAAPLADLSMAAGLHLTQAQQDSLANVYSGVVIDDNEKPVRGASVQVKDGTLSTVTDSIGTFRIAAGKGDVLLIGLKGTNIGRFTLTDKKTPVITVSSKAIPVQASQLVQLLNNFNTAPELTAASTDAVYTRDLVKSNVTNVRNALTGRLTGLYTQQNSGRPGFDAVSTTLRGQQSPLLIIDGIPRRFGSDMELQTIINLEEIESVTVLKDALATAMLGARSSNGALLITTRKGFEGRQRISFTAQTAVQRPINMPRALGAYDYARLHNEAQTNEGLPTIFTPEQLEGYRTGSNPYLYPDVNWRDEVLKSNSRFDRYNFNVSGGGKTARYFVAAEHFNQTGIFVTAPDSNDFNTNNDLKSYMIRSNVDINITSKLSAGIYLMGRIMHGNEPGASTNSIFNSLLTTPNLAYPVRNPNGSLAGTQQFQNNILGQTLYSGHRENYRRDIMSDFYLRRELDEITPGLWIKGIASFSSTLSENTNRSMPFVVFQGVNLGTEQERYTQFGNPGQQANSTSIEYQGRHNYFEGSLGYDRRFSDHGVSAVVLWNRDNSLAGLSGGASNNVLGAQQITLPLRFTGVSGRFVYDFQSKYVAEFAFGYNGSNRYPGGTDRGFFPAVGLAWNVTEESFLKNNDVLNYLKLSGSFGRTGWDNPGYFNYIQYYFDDGPRYPFGTGMTFEVAMREQQIANPDITWEKANKFNLGVEGRVLNNQLAFSVEYFRNKFYDLLMQRGRNSALLGNTYPNENIGRNRYNGVEMQLTWQQNVGALNYYISGNASTVQSEVLYQDEVFRQYDWMRRTGQQVNQRFGYIAEGFFQSEAEAQSSPTILGYVPQAGDIKYRDLNDDGVIDQFDQAVIGNTKPLFFYGVDLGFSIKGFDFSALIQGVQNRDLYLSGNSYWEFQSGGFGQAYEHQLNRWTPENAANATYPRLTVGESINNHAVSSFWVRSGDYLRLKNMEVGYTLPVSLTSRVRLQSVRVFANGLNLFTRSDVEGMDPEVPRGAYPLQRVMNMGVNIKL